MKKVIKKVGKNIVQITTVDERWYIKEDVKGNYTFVPSSTWITSYYPKGVGFMKWLASKGWDEAEAIKQEAGDKGSKVHYVIEDLLKGKPVKMEDKYVNPTTEEEEELTIKEWECVMSFVDWFEEVKKKSKSKVEILATEIVGFNEKDGYAGTIDCIMRIDGQVYIIDWKTSKSIWPSHELQISSYSHLPIDYNALGIKDEQWKNRKLMILQLGYDRNKIKKYKVTPIEDQYDIFLSTRKIWEKECSNIEPKQKDYPTKLKLKLMNRDIEEEDKRRDEARDMDNDERSEAEEEL